LSLDLSFTLLASPTPGIYQMPSTLEHFEMPVGISGRRAALRYLLQWKDRLLICFLCTCKHFQEMKKYEATVL